MNENMSEKDAICYLEALKNQIRGRYKDDERVIAAINLGIQRIKETMVPTDDEPIPFNPDDSGNNFINF